MSKKSAAFERIKVYYADPGFWLGTYVAWSHFTICKTDPDCKQLLCNWKDFEVEEGLGQRLARMKAGN
jgi:hypothetical protein